MRIGLIFLSALISTWLPASAGAKGRDRHIHSNVIEVVDRTRADPFQAGPRRWEMYLFPTADADRAYAPDEALLEDMAKSGYYGQSESTIRSWAKREMIRPSRSRAKPTPVILLFPGQGVAAFNYSQLAGEIVRRGFAVVVVDLPYLGYARGADGKFRRASDDPASKSDDPLAMKHQLADWSRDVAVSVETLRRSPIASKLDLRRIVAAGHSLGGAVALDACRTEQHVVACADFEGAPFGTEIEREGPVKPTLFVLSRSLKPDRPLVTPDSANPMFAFLKTLRPVDSWAVAIGGGSHMSFSDAPLVMPDTLSQFGGELMSPSRSMTVYSTILTAFAEAYGCGRNDGEAFATTLKVVPEARAAKISTATATTRQKAKP